MEMWERNLDVLARTTPELVALLRNSGDEKGLTVERARNGELTVKRDGIYLHSSFDPSREAAGWVEKLGGDSASPLTVAGFGLGYHLKALAEAGFRGTFIEPDVALFRLAMQNLDMVQVLERFQPLVGLSAGQLRRAHRDLLAGRLVAHPPSVRTSPDCLGEITNFADALARIRQGGLKILLVNPLAGGSLPAAHHCAAALTRQGHEVVTFAAEAFAAGMEFCNRYTLPEHRQTSLNGLETYLSGAVELLARECEPDLVLALAQAPLLSPTLQRFRSMGIPTAFWFVEDYSLLPYWRTLAADYGYFFAIQHGRFTEELARAGVRHQAYLPTAAAPEVHLPLQLDDAERQEYGSPLSFVGAGYHNRQHFFRGLIDYPFRIWGSDWPLTPPLAPFIQRQAARISPLDCVKIFNASTINLNLHSSTHHLGIDPAGDFVNPRTFEIAACDAFQLVDRRSHMAELFADDEMETFTSMGELRDKIDHYLHHDGDRRRLSARARNRVLKEHTYDARMEELLALMYSVFPSIGVRHRDRLAKKEAGRAEMQRIPGFGDILKRIPAGKDATLQNICAVISTGSGSLSRSEKIFLMMRNIRYDMGDE